MKCQRCKTELSGDSLRFCYVCGAEIKRELSIQEQIEELKARVSILESHGGSYNIVAHRTNGKRIDNDDAVAKVKNYLIKTRKMASLSQICELVYGTSGGAEYNRVNRFIVPEIIKDTHFRGYTKGQRHFIGIKSAEDYQSKRKGREMKTDYIVESMVKLINNHPTKVWSFGKLYRQFYKSNPSTFAKDNYKSRLSASTEINHVTPNKKTFFYSMNPSKRVIKKIEALKQKFHFKEKAEHRPNLFDDKPYMAKRKPIVEYRYDERMRKIADTKAKIHPFPKLNYINQKYISTLINMLKRIIKFNGDFNMMDAGCIEIEEDYYEPFLTELIINAKGISDYLGIPDKFIIDGTGKTARLIYKGGLNHETIKEPESEST